MNDPERINYLKREIENCKKASQNRSSLVVVLLGAGAVGYYLFDDSHPSVLVGGIVGVSLGFYIWIKLRSVYKNLIKAYEAELEAAKSNQ